MKQILQNLGNGETILADVPCPRRGSGAVLIQTTRSLVSLGTEKMLIDFGKGSLIAKARYTNSTWVLQCWESRRSRCVQWLCRR